MENLQLQWEYLEKEIIDCRLCPRLVEWREQVARTRRAAYRQDHYWGKPVPGFGDRAARLVVVGLAPGAHGSNRTGRMFTGDSSGEFLYRALYKAGFADQPVSTSRDDDLILWDVFITAVCRCVPPKNKPAPQEISNCQGYLEEELHLQTNTQGIVALGRIAFEQVQRLYRQRGNEIPRLKFEHGGFYSLGESLPWLLASYHPSRQNTQTGRLSEAVFDEIWQSARMRLA